MTIGALLDLGLDFDYLKTELKKLPVDGYELRASRVMRSNLSAMKFDVLMEGASENHKHEHHHGGHGHFHRKASEILSMIRESNLSGGAKQFAADIFTKLAISEGKVHSVPPDDVEFHERRDVGAPAVQDPQATQRAAGDPAPDAQAALPDRERTPPVVRDLAGRGDQEIDPPADQPGRESPQGDLVHELGLAGSLARDEDRCKHREQDHKKRNHHQPALPE